MIDFKAMRFLFGMVLVFLSFILQAQPLPDPPPFPPPANPVPITGIEILIGAGVLLGAKRMMANRKTNP